MLVHFYLNICMNSQHNLSTIRSFVQSLWCCLYENNRMSKAVFA